MADQAAVDAMSAALGDLATGTTPEPEVKPDVVEQPDPVDAAGVDGEGSSDAEGADGEKPEGEAEAGEGDEEGGEGEESEGAEPEVNPRRPDGTFKSKAEIAAEKEAAKKAAAPEGEAPAKPDDKGQKPGEKPAKDPVNDPIPQGLKEETRERMTNLVSLVKERDAIIEKQQVLFDHIANTGASPDEFGLMLGYMKAVHSEDPKDLEFAYGVLNNELRAIAIKLGKPTAGVDLLSENPDLQEMVEAGTLKRDVANELALNRARVKDAAARKTAQEQQAARTNQNQNAEVTAAKAQLNELGVTLSELDPNYEVYKKEALKTLGNALQTTPPPQWVATFRQHYKAAKDKVIAAQRQKQQGQPPAGAAPKGQPLRANKQPTGQGAKQPGSALEAMSAALSDKFGV